MQNQAFNILLAEDNEDDVIVLRTAMKRAGVPDTLHVVRDGVAAIHYLNGEQDFADRQQHPFPDFMLLDLKMPWMDGFQVLRAVRASKEIPPLPIHVMSTSAMDDDVGRAYELGANGYLVKPLDMADLTLMMLSLHNMHCEMLFPTCAGQAVKEFPRRN